MVLEASQGNFDTGQTEVVYQFDYNGVNEDSAQYDENTNVNDLDAQAALEINLTNAPKSEIIEEDVLEASGNAGRTHAVDRRRGSTTRGERIRQPRVKRMLTHRIKCSVQSDSLFLLEILQTQ